MKKVIILFLFLMTVGFLSGCNLFRENSGKELVDKPKRQEVYIENGYYFNDKYGVKAQLLPNFIYEFLPADAGIMMKRSAEREVVDKNISSIDKYEVKISLSIAENIEGYKNVSDYVAKKYVGYTQEFFGDGVYVNQKSGEMAFCHYFVMSPDGDYVYDAQLELPSRHYNYHKEGYDNFVKSLALY